MATKSVTVFMSIAGAVCILAGAGCVSSKVTWAEGGVPEKKKPYGSYDASFAGDGVLNKKRAASLFKGGDQNVPDGPLAIAVSASRGRSVDSNGGLAYLNNVLSVCTLGVWPHVESKTTEYEIFARSRFGSCAETVKVGERSWSSFLLPVAALPCPGWGDARGQDADEFASEMLCSTLGGMLDKDYYDKTMAARAKHLANCREAASRIRESIEKRNESSPVGEDLRPVVFVSDQSVDNKTKCHVDTRSVFDRLEHALVKAGLRVETHAALRKNAADNAVFAVIKGKAVDLSQIKSPAYRVEVSVLQYKCEGSQQDLPSMRHKKHTFKKASHSESMTHIEKKDAVAEMAFKFVNMKTGETELSKNFCGRKDGTFTSSTGTFSGHKKSEVTSSTSGDALRSDDYYLELAADEAMSQFVEAMLELLPFNVVSCSPDGTLVMDAPGDFVKKGAVLNIMSLGREMAGRNGRVYRSEKKIGTVVVTAESGDSCTGQIDTVDTLDCDWDIVVRRQKAK